MIGQWQSTGAREGWRARQSELEWISRVAWDTRGVVTTCGMAHDRTNTSGSWISRCTRESRVGEEHARVAGCGIRQEGQWRGYVIACWMKSERSAHFFPQEVLSPRCMAHDRTNTSGSWISD
jgi:hypothetical protein